MNIIKRNGVEVEFDIDKIRRAISRANNEVSWSSMLTSQTIEEISNKIESQCNTLKRAVSVEEIQDMVENALMDIGNHELARTYITYRYKRALIRQGNTTDGQILSLIESNNEEVKQENSNKNPTVSSVQRDYMAGEVSKDLSRRKLLPKDVVDAHDKGIIHFHDMDYYAQHMHNCDLLNLDDMLQNGTVISGTMIEKPHSFATACNIATQIIAQVASSQYGGQTITLSHLAPFVDVSRKKIKKQVESEIAILNKYNPASYSSTQIDEIVEARVKDEVKRGVQTIQYQVVTLMTTNGQAPFITVFMYIDEVPEGQIREDLCMIIEEMLNQRIEGVKNQKGIYITPAFPKLIYCLDEDNIHPDSKYYYLTKLAAKCTAKRMVPDYISAKVMRELKGDVYPCMGAAVGDETVSIKIHGQEFNNIRIEDAVNFIRVVTKHSKSCKQINTNLQNVSGVYQLTHTPSGLFYVGSSKNIGRRLAEHRYTLRHNKSLGDNYFIGDDDINNLDIKVLETCDWDNLSICESKWYNSLNCDMCVNQKDPINNGNFDSYNRVIALAGLSYSKYTNMQNTWIREIKDPEILIRSRNSWVPVRAIMINSEESPLNIYEVTYCKDGKEKSIKITEDHPMHTRRGRVRCDQLVEGDELVDSVEDVFYSIKSIHLLTEHVPTYDFETDTDTFNLSGLLSHNCRSFLTPDRFSDAGAKNLANAKNYIPGKHIYYSRFNQGVVTINLVDAGLSANKDLDNFWNILDERLELCHKALRCRHERLKGTLSDVAPILWQHGALARLEKGEKIDKLLYGGYSTISLGYAGLWECVYSLIGRKLTEPEGEELGLKIMKTLNDYTAKWKAAEDIDYSIYGTPIESTTYKFAKCLQKRFGIIKGVTDKSYITNSYHVHVTEDIDAFHKLALESKFQAMSPGGAISYVEVPNMQQNIPAVLEVMNFIYHNIMYAELNTKSDYCQVCGYDGEIQIVEDKNGKLIWKCPNCGNEDQSKMNVARRVCGYISTNFFNQGRTQEIKERKLHL